MCIVTHTPCQARGDRADLPLGGRRRLTGDLERITKIYEAALDVYRTLPTTSQRPPPSVDILEIFAGEAKPSARASRFGLNACQPFDLNFGWDLSQPDQQRMIMNVVRRLRPWAIIIGYPGTLYSVFGENINDKADEYLLRRAADQPMRVRQYEAGRLFFLDNPKNSRLWSQTEMASLLDLPGVTTTTAHFGACGAETADGQPIKKAIQIMSNFPGLSRDFGKRLSATDLLYCTPVQGNLSATTQVYPDAFVDQLLTSIKGWIAQHEPQRFGYFTVYALSRPTVDAAAWDNVFKQVERSFVGSNRRPYIVDPDSTFGKEIQDLFRMDAVRIQVANTPTQRRFHSDIPHLARGAALQHIDGSRLVEVEQLDEVRQPKGRFSKPVQFAVFIYGSSRQADELQQSTQEDPGPEVPIGGLPTDVNFPGCDKIPISVRRSVARLHVNLGHPSAQELSRLLCHRGVPSAGVQECVRKLSCATCKRLAGMRHTAVGRGTTFPPASSQQLLLYMFLAVVVQGLLLLIPAPQLPIRIGRQPAIAGEGDDDMERTHRTATPPRHQSSPSQRISPTTPLCRSPRRRLLCPRVGQPDMIRGSLFLHDLVSLPRAPRTPGGDDQRQPQGDDLVQKSTQHICLTSRLPGPQVARPTRLVLLRAGTAGWDRKSM